MKMMSTGAVLCACCLGVTSGFAGEWFADAARPAGTGDGKTEATAFHTIQEAVDAAASGDTVTVLPGIYDDGGYVDAGGYTNRVAIIGKKLTLRAKSSDRDATHIVGAHDLDGCYLDKDPTKNHYPLMGPKAVRGILVANANDTRIEGFTIRDAASHEVPASDNAYGTGGGVLVKSNSRKVYIADCTFRNCVSSRGGGLRAGTAIRCHFDRCLSYYGDGQASRDAYLYCCLITRGGYQVIGCSQFCSCRIDRCTIVQCTQGVAFDNNTVVANSIELLNNTYPGPDSEKIVATNVLVRALSHSSSGKSFFSTNSLNVALTSADDYPFIAPAIGDFRMRAGTVAATYGDAALELFDVPEADRDLDFEKKAVPASGAIPVGCYSSTVTPVGGGWAFRHVACVNGWTNDTANSWYYATETSQCVRVSFVCAEGEYPFCFDLTTGIRYPQIDGSVYLMAPPAEYGIANCRLYTATNVLYVAKNGSDTDNDGRSAATPFKSIQHAIASAPHSSSGLPALGLYYNTIIRVGEGIYGPEDGTTVMKDQTSTLAVGNRRLTIVGSDGPEKCIIVGAPDADTVETSEYGCGPNAVRCAAVDATARCVFQRFTFTGGYTVAYSGTGYGGALSGAGDHSCIADCIITNCVGNRGSVVYNGRLERCRIRDCRDYYCYIRASTAVNCLFECDAIKTRDGFIGQDAHAYGCTLVNRSVGSACLSHSDQSGYCTWSTILYRGSSALNGSRSANGNVYYDSGAPDPSQDSLAADPEFANVDGCDYRLLSSSPAIGHGATTNEYWKYAGGDLYGNAPRVVNGRPTAGAIHSVATARITVAAPPDGTVTPVGVTALAPGESVTVTMTPGVRNPIGYLVNGETQTVASAAAGWTVTAPPYVAGTAASTFTVSALYSPHWYVSPTGSNDNKGWTAETPFETLAYAVSLATNAGDVVHAAAGAYTNGWMLQAKETSSGAADPVIRARVVVPENVTLVADEGPEVTFIMGEMDHTASATPEGSGDQAMRCVFLDNFARVKGFTICNGRVNGTTADNVNSVGSGVYSRSGGNSSYCGVTENCIISNHYGRAGGGTYRGKIIGCRFYDCHSIYGGAIGRYCSMYNCFADRNWGARILEIYYAAENCTFGPNNLTSNGSSNPTLLSEPQAPASGQPKAVAKNCVFLDYIAKAAGKAIVATNCYFRNDSADYYPDETNRFGCTLASLGEMKLSSDCMPAKDSPLVDAGDASLMSTLALDGADARGGQRVYNGAPDIGAFEYDWRPEYATMLGVTTVTEASTKVVGALGANSVTIGSGDLKLSISGGSTAQRNIVTVPFAVYGDGIFSVATNGVTVGTFTAASGAQTLKLVNRLETTDLAFSYDGDDDGVVLSRLSHAVQGLLLLVR